MRRRGMTCWGMAALVLAVSACGEPPSVAPRGGSPQAGDAAPEVRRAEAAPAAVDPAAPVGRPIRVRVVGDSAGDRDAVPVRGAVVEALAVPDDAAERHHALLAPLRDRPSVRAETDDEGRATLDLPDDATALVVASADGFAPRSVLIPAGDAAAEREIRVGRAAQLRVTVVDPLGRPVPGAEVRAGDEEENDRGVGRVRPFAWGVTDADGRTTLAVDARFRASRSTLDALAPGRVMHDVGVNRADVAEFCLDARIVMEPERVWAGWVVDRLGEPVPGARVAAASLATRTAADGAFRLAGLRAEFEKLTIDADGFAEWSWSSWPGREDLRIRLRRNVRVRGVVVLPDGSPAAGANVNFAATTAADGRFEIDVAEGTSNVFVLLGGGRVGSQRSGNAWLEADPENPPDDVRVVLDREYSWAAVRVVDEDGAPVQGMTVWFRPLGGQRLAKSSDVNGQASMEFSAAPGTDVDVRVDGDRGFEPRAARTKSVGGPGPGPAVEVVLAPSRQAADGAGGTESALGPTGAVEVFLAGAGDRSVIVDVRGHGSPGAVDASPEIGAERVLLQRVPAGRRLVSVIDVAARNLAWSRFVDVVPGATARIEFPGFAPRVLRGRVVGPDGKPLGGTAINVETVPQFLARRHADASTDGEGRFEVVIGGGDRVWLFARRDGFARTVVAVDADATPADDTVEIRLPAPGSVRVLVPDGDWAQEDARAAAPDGEVEFLVHCENGDDGTERIDDLPAGRWRFRVTVCYESREFEAEVRSGETTTVDLRR